MRFWIGGEGALNQHLFKVTSKYYPLWFCYFWILYHLEDFRNIAEEKATTMGHIKREHLSSALCLIPNNFKIMDIVLYPLIEKIINNEKENFTLTKIRDALLPKLMNGKIEL
jgi:type I restriction enzyme S subunit